MGEQRRPSPHADRLHHRDLAHCPILLTPDGGVVGRRSDDEVRLRHALLDHAVDPTLRASQRVLEGVDLKDPVSHLPVRAKERLDVCGSYTVPALTPLRDLAASVLGFCTGGPSGFFRVNVLGLIQVIRSELPKIATLSAVGRALAPSDQRVVDGGLLVLNGVRQTAAVRGLEGSGVALARSLEGLVVGSSLVEKVIPRRNIDPSRLGLDEVLLRRHALTLCPRIHDFLIGAVWTDPSATALKLNRVSLETETPQRGVFFEIVFTKLDEGARVGISGSLRNFGSFRSVRNFGSVIGRRKGILRRHHSPEQMGLRQSIAAQPRGTPPRPTCSAPDTRNC